MRPALAVLLALVAATGSALFLYEFEANLHCTQWTSFRIAVFDMQPHPEEEVESSYLPVYDAPTSVPLRVLLASLLLAFLFWPTVGIVAQLAGKTTSRVFRVVTFLLWAALALLALAGPVVGERFQWLYLVSLLVGIPLYLVGFAGDWLVRSPVRGRPN